MIIGMEFGKFTEKEVGLTNYILKCIADYVEKNSTDRNELIACMARISHIVFSKQTPFEDIKKQHAEIDGFCDFLKFQANLERFLKTK